MMRHAFAVSLVVAAAPVFAGPPPNDAFAAAIVQTGDFWLTSGTLHEATSEPNEPILTYQPNGPTAWWQWTPATTGSVRLRTWGSERPNMLAVYRGTSLDTLRLIEFASSHNGRENSAEVAFSATAGETYRIQVLGADYSNPFSISQPVLPGRVQISLVPAAGGSFAPPNDSFAAASPLSGASGELLVCNTNATSEAGEPLGLPGSGGDSVWVQWSAPSAGVWSVSADRTDFDNLLAVYTGTSVNVLTRINYSDVVQPILGAPNYGGGMVRLRATAGQTFHFQLLSNGLGGTVEYGLCHLTLQPAAPPPNDDFVNALALTGSAPTADGWATFATREPGEPGAQGDESGSLWWTWTAPGSALLSLIAYDGAVEAYTGTSVAALTPLPFDPRSGGRSSLGGITSWHPVTAGTVVRLRARPAVERVAFAVRLLTTPPNDDFANRQPLVGATATASVDLSGASWENNEINTDGFGPQTVWYRWTAPSTGRIAFDTIGSPDFTTVMVFTGSSFATMTPVGEQKILGLGAAASDRRLLEAVSGTEYALQLRRTTIAPGLATLNIRPPTPPPNDHFANASVMAGSAWTATGTNADATTEPNEPSPSQFGTTPNSSVWWRWFAPASGLFRVTAAGSGIDTVLTIHTGASLGSLTSVAEDQSAGWLSTGAVLFSATAGTTYHLRVDGQSNSEGAIRLSLQPAPAPPNDAFVSRLPLGGLGTAAMGNLLAATLDPGEPNPSAPNGGHSVWFDWTAPTTGTAQFRVRSERFQAALGIYTGGTLESLIVMATAGSGGAISGTATRTMRYPVTSGTSYKIRIDGLPTTNGNYQLGVSMPAPPLNDAFDARFKLEGTVVRAAVSTAGATAQTGEPAPAGFPPFRSLWHEWTASSAGDVTIDTAGSALAPRLAVYTGTALDSLTLVVSAAIPDSDNITRVRFAAVQGATYLIVVDSSAEINVLLNLVSAASVPGNDAFVGASVVTSDEWETLAQWSGASAEAGEPAHGGRPAARSLWSNWTPQTSRRARLWFETESSSLLARIAVYRGTALGSLTQIAATTSDTPQARLDADVVAGETYRVVIDTRAAAAIPGWIRWGIAPVNGTADQAYPIAPENGVVSADTTGAFTPDVSFTPTGRRELWWAWTPEVCARMEWRAFAAPGSGITLAIVPASSSSSFVGTSFAGPSIPVPGSGEIVKTFDAEPDVTYFLKLNAPVAGPVHVQLAEAPRQPPPDNDLSHRAMPMAGASWSVPVTLGAETEDRQWWSWTAPTAGVAEVKLDGTLAETDLLLAYGGEDIPFTSGAGRTNGGAPVLRLASQAGTRWRLVSQTSLRRLRPATLSLFSPANGTPPVNDSWDTPQVLGASWTNAPGDVTLASCQPGEPDHSNSGGTGVATILPPGRSVWYDWTPASSSQVTLRFEAGTDLAMRVYSGATRAQWLPVEEVMPGEHRLSFFARAGEAYHVAVATRPPLETTAPFTLRFGGPPNDLLAGAIVLAGASATSSVDSAGAGAEEGEPGYGFNFETPRASLWWNWTAAAAGSVWIDTLGSEFDTVLTVFGTDPPDTTSRIAENDNASQTPGATASAVRFATTAGQTYLIRVCRRDATEPSGLATINLTTTPPPGPYPRWLAGFPTLTGPASLELADPDDDGLPNLAELALGTSPIIANSRGSLVPTPTASGWQVEAALDRDALDSAGEGTSIEVLWQTSRNLINWQPAPAASVVRRDGRLTIERILLTPDDPPFARLLIRPAR